MLASGCFPGALVMGEAAPFAEIQSMYCNGSHGRLRLRLIVPFSSFHHRAIRGLRPARGFLKIKIATVVTVARERRK
jgi:hypothetical protein